MKQFIKITFAACRLLVLCWIGLAQLPLSLETDPLTELPVANLGVLAEEYLQGSKYLTERGAWSERADAPPIPPLEIDESPVDAPPRHYALLIGCGNTIQTSSVTCNTQKRMWTQ